MSAIPQAAPVVRKHHIFSAWISLPWIFHPIDRPKDIQLFRCHYRSISRRIINHDVPLGAQIRRKWVSVWYNGHQLEDRACDWANLSLHRSTLLRPKNPIAVCSKPVSEAVLHFSDAGRRPIHSALGIRFFLVLTSTKLCHGRSCCVLLMVTDGSEMGPGPFYSGRWISLGNVFSGELHWAFKPDDLVLTANELETWPLSRSLTSPTWHESS